MTKTAPISSAMAKAVINILSDIGTRSPIKYKTPKENAISVAIGIPHPSDAAPDPFNDK